MKRLLIPLLALAIIGAGCSPEPSSPTPPSGSTSGNTTTTTQPTPTPSTDTSATGHTDGMATLTPAKTDSTWKTYVNVALGFSFMYPTKGTYAPQWEVKVFKDTDAQVHGGCYAVTGGEVGEPSMPMVGSQMFCHTSASEGAAGSTYFTDAYSTPFGHAIVVLVFTKQVTNAGIIPNCSAQYSTVSNACVPFTVADYEAALDGIVGTFQLTE